MNLTQADEFGNVDFYSMETVRNLRNVTSDPATIKFIVYLNKTKN